MSVSPVRRISVYERIIQRQKILRVTDLVFINKKISLSLRKSEEIRKEARQHILCEFGIIKVSHSHSCPTGVQAEAEQGSGTVCLHGNTAGVQ